MQHFSSDKDRLSLSVVMPVYKNDRSSWFKQSFESILGQSLLPEEIIIVRDGPVSDELESTLRHYELLYTYVRVLRLVENIGAGQARNKAINLAKGSLIAIADADDISLPGRFAEQVAEFRSKPELVLLGGQISEFQGEADNIIGYRRVPSKADEIKKFARLRSPINHVTVMFRKASFVEIGGYPDLTRSEDYYMVSLMLSRGLLVENLDAVMVNYRANVDNMRRRKSWRSVRENVYSRKKMHQMGMISRLDFFISSAMQLLLFITPVGLVRALFVNILRSKV